MSLQTRQSAGLAAWDTFQTLVETARKQGVNVYRYFYDRLSKRQALPSLALLIEQAADKHRVSLKGSWLSPTSQVKLSSAA